MSNDYNEHVPEAVHADDLDVSEADMEAALSYDEPENGIEAIDTPQMTETKPTEDTEVEDAKEESKDETEAEPAPEETEVEVEDGVETTEASTQTEQPRIPKSRFDEVNKRAKDAEAKAEALQREFEALKAGMQHGQQPAKQQAEQPAQPAFDFNSKEQEYMDAVLDGETDKALAIRSEIREAERNEFQSVAQTKSTESVEQMQMRNRVQEAVVKLNQAMPIFDETSGTFNQEALNEALTIRNGYMAQGIGPIEAMQKAAGMINKVYGGTVEKDTAPPTQQPVAKKKVETANKQPPSIGTKSGEAADTGSKVDVMSMSEKDFDSLSEEEINKLLAG